MKKALPPLTTMMLDALVGTLKHMPEKSRYAAIARCVFNTYMQTYGVKPPWEVLGEKPSDCEKRVKIMVLVIEDNNDKPSNQSTRILQKNRRNGSRLMAMSGARMSRQGAVPGPNGKRVQTRNDGSGE